ncbi:MAG: plasmid mobilization relaxosome protein MobC [Acidobacteriota bacterium]
MSSGSDKRQRTKRHTDRYTTDEFNAIAAKADRAGLSFSAFVRASLLGDAGPRAQRRPPADHKALRQILGLVGRIGNNINQIARTLNTGGEVSQPELREALTAYLDIRTAIFEALGKNPGPGT